MSKKQLIVGLAALIVLVGGYLVFTKSQSGTAPATQEPPATVINSDDGLATLTIPDGALPEGTSASDITVKSVTAKAGSTMYELSPDGLTLNGEATFKATVEHDEDGSVPVLYHISQDWETVDLVNKQKVLMDMETGKTDISGPVSHFSKMYVGGLLGARTTGAAVFAGSATSTGALVKQHPSATFVFSKTGDELKDGTEDGEHKWSYSLKPDSVTFSGSYRAIGKLSPKEVEDRPSTTAMTGDSYTVTASEFVCDEKGFAYIIYDARVYFTEITTFEDPSFQREEKKDIFVAISSPWFECEANPEAEDDDGGGGVTTGGGGVTTGGGGETGGAGGESGGTETAQLPIIEMTYAHVKPGQYSEVYASVTAKPGETVVGRLAGPAVNPPADQKIVADENGVAYFTWRIFQYGIYHGMFDIADKLTATPWRRTVTVQ
jgi:hypothetical protein